MELNICFKCALEKAQMCSEILPCNSNIFCTDEFRDKHFTIPNLKDATWDEALKLLNLEEVVSRLHFHQHLLLMSIACTIQCTSQARELLSSWNKIKLYVKCKSGSLNLFSLLRSNNSMLTFHRCLKFFSNATDSEGNTLLHHISADQKLLRNERLLFTKILLAQSKQS